MAGPRRRAPASITEADRAGRQRGLLDRITRRAEASPEIVGLLLFGSFATGTEDDYSDLDLGLYVADEALATFDLRTWLAPIADVAAIHVDPYCSTVIFGDLIRAEVHLGPVAAALAAWPPLAGVLAYPSLDRIVLLDRTGVLRAAVAPLVGRLPERGPEDGAAELLGLASDLLVVDACRRRGDLAKALVQLGSAQRHLLRLARLAEGALNEWIAPERRLVTDLSAAAYRRYAMATACLDARSIRRAVDRSWRWGRDLAREAGAAPFDAPTLEALDRRFSEA